MACQLGFFAKKNLDSKNKNEHLNLYFANLKHKRLEQMYYAFLEQELKTLIIKNWLKQTKTKEKKLKIFLMKRLSKRRLNLKKAKTYQAYYKSIQTKPELKPNLLVISAH